MSEELQCLKICLNCGTKHDDLIHISKCEVCKREICTFCADLVSEKLVCEKCAHIEAGKAVPK